MKVSFATSWFLANHRATEPITESKARAIHASGKRYVAIIGDPLRPYCVLEIRLETNYVAVMFMDINLRDYLVYVFGGYEGDLLFLQRMVSREYIADTDKVKNAVVVYFKEDGTAIKDETDVINKTRKSTQHELDISDNWEPIPKFGEYDSIMRLERNKPEDHPDNLATWPNIVH